MKLAIATFAILAGICAAKPFHGYLVTGQWDGRTFPDVEWALDITRQVTEWRPQQELKYQNLIPTTAGPALKPTYTAYDAKSRTYFLTTQRNDTAASLWGIVISADTNSSKPVGNEVRFRYPAEHDTLNGLEVWNNNGQLNVLAIFGNCTILKVDYTTGKTSVFGTACDNTRQTTTAMELNPAKNELFIITQSFSASTPARQLVTIDLTTAKYTAVPLADLKNHDANQEYPFELGYFPTLDAVLVFYTGKFDQMIFVERSGKTTFGIFDLAEYDGPEGFYAFTADDYLEDDDFWSDIARDPTTGEVYFQCTTIDPVSGEPSIAMCMMPTPKQIGTIQYINVAIWPLTYGYAGLQWVDIVS